MANDIAKQSRVEKFACYLCEKLCKNNLDLSMHMTSSHLEGHSVYTVISHIY